MARSSRILILVFAGAATVWACSSDYGAKEDGPAAADSGPGSDANRDDASVDAAGEGGVDAACTIPPSAALDDVIGVAGSDLNTCAIRQDGSLWCWGDNSYGQLGVPQSITLGTSKPQKVVFPASLGTAKITRALLDYKMTLAIDSELRVWVWGNNESGLLANGAKDTNAHAEPALVELGNTPLLVQHGAAALMYSAACVLATTDDVYCWGTNMYGLLGPNNGTNDSFTPTKAFQFPQTAMKSAVLGNGTGSIATCFSSGGTTPDALTCWGEKGGGYLLMDTGATFGAGVNAAAAAPLIDAGATMPVTDIQFGTNSGCTLDSASHIYCWGVANNFFEHGPTAPPAGRAAITPGTFRSMAFAYVSFCAIDDTSTVRCRGDNMYGELGRPTGDAGKAPDMDPVLLADGGPLRATSLGAGTFHVCAILEGACGPKGPGPLVCWGQNDKGQLGVDIPGQTTSIVPVSVQAP